MLKKLIPIFAVLLVAACASIGVEQPESFDQRLAYAYGTNTAVRSAAANAVTVGTIDKSDAQFILKQTDDARALLDASRLALSVGDVSTAEGRLVLAVGILTQLQQYLNTRAQK